LALYEEAGPTEAEEDKSTFLGEISIVDECSQSLNIGRVEKIFQMFDTDHNNNIDGKEFQQELKEKLALYEEAGPTEAEEDKSTFWRRFRSLMNAHKH